MFVYFRFLVGVIAVCNVNVYWLRVCVCLCFNNIWHSISQYVKRNAKRKKQTNSKNETYFITMLHILALSLYSIWIYWKLCLFFFLFFFVHLFAHDISVDMKARSNKIMKLVSSLVNSVSFFFPFSFPHFLCWVVDKYVRRVLAFCAIFVVASLGNWIKINKKLSLMQALLFGRTCIFRFIYIST